MKKRLLVVLGFILLLSCSVPVMAEEIDFSAMSLDELIELRTGLDAEIRSRLPEDASSIFIGEYRVGTAIRADQYLLTCTNVTDDNMSVHLYSSNDDGDKGGIIWFTYLEVGEKTLITLEEGQILEIFAGEATLVAYPKADWAP